MNECSKSNMHKLEKYFYILYLFIYFTIKLHAFMTTKMKSKTVLYYKLT